MSDIRNLFFFDLELVFGATFFFGTSLSVALRIERLPLLQTLLKEMDPMLRFFLPNDIVAAPVIGAGAIRLDVHDGRTDCLYGLQIVTISAGFHLSKVVVQRVVCVETVFDSEQKAVHMTQHVIKQMQRARVIKVVLAVSEEHRFDKVKRLLCLRSCRFASRRGIEHSSERNGKHILKLAELLHIRCERRAVLVQFNIVIAK